MTHPGQQEQNNPHYFAFAGLFWRVKGPSSLLAAEVALQSRQLQRELVLLDKHNHLSGAASQHPAVTAAAKMQTSAHSEPRAGTAITDLLYRK